MNQLAISYERRYHLLKHGLAFKMSTMPEQLQRELLSSLGQADDALHRLTQLSPRPEQHRLRASQLLRSMKRHLTGHAEDWIAYRLKGILPRTYEGDLLLEEATFLVDRVEFIDHFALCLFLYDDERHCVNVRHARLQMVCLVREVREEFRNRPAQEGEDLDALLQIKEMAIIDVGTQFMLALHQMSLSVSECVKEFESDAPADD